LVLRQSEGSIQVGGALNLGGAAVSSVLDMASEVQRCAGRVLGIEHLLPRMGEVHQRVPDLTRLRELGAPLPSMCLRDIVTDTWTRHGLWPEAKELLTEEPACASLVS
jgi:UDP-glucose 4-epimerase